MAAHFQYNEVGSADLAERDAGDAAIRFRMASAMSRASRRLLSPTSEERTT
ncbi:MAG: hypothetical protein M3Y72_13560 [Acidobacteriota bacterium]|nr:hypothetical protein [Acidobacteriota bacterium]